MADAKPDPKPEPRGLPFPAWLLAADALATALLAAGLWIVASPVQARAIGIPVAYGWIAVVFGGIAALACCVALFRAARRR